MDLMASTGVCRATIYLTYAQHRNEKSIKLLELACKYNQNTVCYCMVLLLIHIYTISCIILICKVVIVVHVMWFTVCYGVL